MKPERQAAIALAAGVPIALFVLWWAYRRHSAQHTGEARSKPDQIRPAKKKESGTTIEYPGHTESGAKDDSKCENEETGELTAISEVLKDESHLNEAEDSLGDVTSSSSIQHPEVEEEQETESQSNYSSTSVPPDNNNDACTDQAVVNTKIILINAPPDEEDPQEDDPCDVLQTTDDGTIEAENYETEEYSKILPIIGPPAQVQEEDIPTEHPKTANGTENELGVSAETTDSALPERTEASIEISTQLIMPSTVNHAESSDSALPDRSDDSSEIATDLVTPSTINLAATGDAPMDTVASISDCETQEETEPSLIQFSETNDITQDSNFTANNTTNLLDNAITDSTQFNMSLPASQSECDESQAEAVENVTQSEWTNSAFEIESQLEESSENSIDDNSQVLEYETDEASSFAVISSETSLSLERSEALPRHSEDSKAPMVADYQVTTEIKDVTDESESPILQGSADKCESGAETKLENTQNENNNNNNNSRDTEKLVNGTEDNQTDSKAIILGNDTEKHTTMENGDTHDDSEKINGNSDPLHNKNGLIQPKLPMQNGHSPENYDKETQIYLEFPSEKVGLLIGKLGRNIKNLKQESGAEIMVHTVPFRDDIQVLQIVGTPTSVELAASKIQKRFREVPLKEFDAANSMGLISPSSIISSSSGVMSPMESPLTPPTFAYPVPDMSQLRLPDGIIVEVIVSAIADCDCVFLQQYTHPTYHALASLEHAMAMCYSVPATPSLLTPVQVGLVCVAQHGDIWYRAQVIHSDEVTNEVTIRFVDYGGYATVPISTVKQIRADFITLPFQATECYLDNISPPEGETAYSAESTTVLQDLLKEGEFHARISRYRGDGHPLILLYKRGTDKTDLVNELLVEEGVATWVDYGNDSSIMTSQSELQ